MSNYTESVEHYLEGIEAVSVGACPGCHECDLDEEPTEEEVQLAEEPWFSWHGCDSCGSTYGGDRHPAHGLDESSGDLLHLTVCTDCLFYIANGDEPEQPWYRTPSEYQEAEGN